MSDLFKIIAEWLLVMIAVLTCLLSATSSYAGIIIIVGKSLQKNGFFRAYNLNYWESYYVTFTPQIEKSIRKFPINIQKSLTSLLNKADIVLELTSHFQIQYMAINLCTLILFWVNHRLELWWLVSMAGIGINLAEIGRWYVQEPDLEGEKRVRFRILQINILHENKQYAKAIARVREVQPDLAVFLEISKNWMKELEVLQDCFPYYFRVRDSDNYGSGVAIYSRLPLEEASTRALTGGRKSLVACIRIEGMPVLIVATHLSNPARKRGFQKRNKQLAELGDYVAKAKHPVVVSGDFNTTMWSPYYKRFSRQTGLRNARAGFGIMPTWPARSPLFYIPIDHCLVSREIQIVKSRTGRSMGSDHLPLITDLAISTKTDRTGNLLSG